MKYFKDKNNQGVIWGLSPLDIQNGRDAGLTKLTAKEVQEHLNPPKTEEQIQAEFRAERDKLLAEVDVQINIAFDNNLDTLEDLKAYRQALRDAPETWELPKVPGSISEA